MATDKELLDWLESQCGSNHDFIISLSEGQTVRGAIEDAINGKLVVEKEEVEKVIF